MTTTAFGLHKSWAPVVALISSYDGFFQQRMEEMIIFREKSMDILSGLFPQKGEEEFRSLEERIREAGFSRNRFGRFMDDAMREVCRMVGLSLSDALELRFLISPPLSWQLLQESYFGQGGHWNGVMPSLSPIVEALSKEMDGLSLSDASLKYVTGFLRDTLSYKRVSVENNDSLTFEGVVLFETGSGHIASLSLRVIKALLAYTAHLSGQPLDYHVMASDAEIDAFGKQDFWQEPAALSLRGLAGGTLTCSCSGAVMLHFPSSFDAYHMERLSGRCVNDGLEILETYFRK